MSEVKDRAIDLEEI